MKSIILALVCFGFIGVFAQNPLEKIAPKLQLKMQLDSQADKYLIWVYFTDKGNKVESYYSNPQTVVSLSLIHI